MKQTEQKNSKRAMLGAAVTVAAYLGLLAFSALLLEQGRVDESRTALCVTVSACLAAFSGAKTAGWRMTKPLIPAAECVGTAFCTVLLIGFLANNTLEVRRVPMLAVSMAAGGACAVLRTGKRKCSRRARR